MHQTDPIEHARTLIHEAKALVILTGAGISAESGLKTFRDGGGLWEEHTLEDVATPEGFRRDPSLVWRFYNARRRAADVATPNPAHLALARLEAGKLHRAKMKPAATNGHGNGNGTSHRSTPPVTILTQNIDGLHQQAGSRHVIELHGSIWQVRCTSCGMLTTEHPIELSIPPICDACDGLLRPNVVWFGEHLDPEVLHQADESVKDCDCFIVVGTSAVVQPAASYPVLAARRGIPVIEVNLERTPVSDLTASCLLGKAGEILPKLIS
jgi:NAD-dependent deacetylase